MRSSTRLFVILWLAGMAGVLSILLLDLPGLIAILPVAADTGIPPMPLLKFLSVLQPAVLLSLAVLIGTLLTSRVGLSAPVAEAAAERRDLMPALRPQIIPAIIGGLLGGFAIVLIALISKPFLSTEVGRISEFAGLTPLAMRVLYGGITEELLLRWGLMTLLVWLLWRLFQRDDAKPKPVYFVAAILISSVMFAVGHLPIAFALFPEPTFALILFVISANSVFGLIAGYLYWKKGLESAILAHMLLHGVLFASSYFGAYF